MSWGPNEHYLPTRPWPCSEGRHLMTIESFACIRCGWQLKLEDPRKFRARLGIPEPQKSDD